MVEIPQFSGIWGTFKPKLLTAYDEIKSNIGINTYI